MKDLKIIIYTLIVLAIILRIHSRISNPAFVEEYYCSTLTRMDSLLIGGLLAIRMKEGLSISKMFIQVILSICGILFFMAWIFDKDLNQNNIGFSTIGYTMFAILFACIIYLSITHKYLTNIIVEKLKGLNFIGKISYGIFVYHIPIYLIISAPLSELFTQLLNADLNAYTPFYTSIISVILTVFLSMFSFYLLEKPILNYKKHFT
jgi:peptidoglycan/LPS O-acetylase OafA/YrhL